VDGLPDVLVAPGLHVELGCHGGEVSVLLLGSWRREVAICRGGEVVWWVHHDDEQGTTRQLLLAAARRWRTEGDLVPVATGWSTRPAVAGLGLLLVVEEAPEVRWAVEVGATTVGGSATAPRGTRPRANRSGGPVDHDELDAIDPSVVEAVQAQLGEAGGRGPIPAPAGRGPLGDRDPFGERVARLHLEPVGRVVVEDRRRATATWLTPGGLQRLVSEGDDDHRTEAPWQVGVRFAWMAEGWEPEPDVVAYALLGEFEAAVVRVGRHLALGVRGDDRVVWWTLRDVPGDLQRTLLGEHLTGEERPLDLRVVTDPGKVQGPTVRDATFIERRIEPVLEEVGAGDGDPDEALRAAAAWVRRTAAFPEPTGPALPEALVAELVQRADELSPPTLETVGIALQVVETWRQGIDEFPVPYRLTPGSTVGAVACVDTGGTSTMVLRDRSGHLVAEVVVCPWCGEGSCHRCHVLVQPCSVCTDAVCGSCALDDGRCPVCSTLAPLDRKQARHLGRKVGRRATVLRAEVDGRTVLAVRDGAWSVTVEQAGALAEPVANDGRAALLDWVAAAPPVAAPTVDPPPPPPPSAPPDGPAPDGDPTATRGAPPVA